jgi:hypothetical protein
MALTSRGRALRWLTNHRRITEQPANSNTDNRKDGIRNAQITCAGGGSWLIGAAWCGIWHYMALHAGGVHGISSRQASVALIEEDARAHRAPYGRGWLTTSDPKWPGKALRGDAVILFGHGVHVETVRSTRWIYRKLGYIRTEGGNTTSGNQGDQANGGGSYPRLRRIADIRGFALAHYPNQ